MSIPLIYIAGPFRGPTPYDVHKNVYAAEALGLTVARLGGYPMIPHTMTAHFDKQLDDQFWLEGTMEMLRRCDAAVFLANWQASTGARGEMAQAIARGLPTFIAEAPNHGWIWEETFERWVGAWKTKTPDRPRPAFVV